ncbi:MAG TPA: DUF4199 domain-containing protein [Cyclobacteriaceae bacterium]|nr:DUF4199 domain-containing protein [Cyclobacteriaceae bacterium]
MKKVILIYGLIAGSIVAAVMFITMPMYQNGVLNLDNGETIGYTTMVIALSLVFFGIKSFRDNHSNGAISFGKGFKVGILITLIASTMYGLSWEVMYPRIGEEFTKKYQEKYFADLKADGATDQEIAEAKKQMESFSVMYKNPVYRFCFSTFVEIFPVGLVITLISAAVLRRKEILPA